MKYLFKSDGSCAVRRVTGIHRGSNAAATILIGFCDDNETEATADNIYEHIGISRENLVVQLCLTYPDNTQSGWMSVTSGGDAPLRYYYRLLKQDTLVEGAGKLNIRWYDSAQTVFDDYGEPTADSVINTSDDVPFIINGGVIAQSPYLTDEEMAPLSASIAEMSANGMRCYDVNRIDDYAIDFSPDGKKQSSAMYFNFSHSLPGHELRGVLLVVLSPTDIEGRYLQTEYLFADRDCYTREIVIDGYLTSSPVVVSVGEFANLLRGIPGEPGKTGATGPQGIQGIQGEKGNHGAAVFIRYSASADGSGMTQAWQPGQRYLGTYIGASAADDPAAYQWMLFVGDAFCSEDATSGAVSVTLTHDTDKTLTAALTSLTVNIPADARHGFYAGLNFKSGSSPPTVRFQNSSGLPLKVLLRGVLSSDYAPASNVTVQGMFYSDGINVYAYLNEVQNE